MQKFLILLIIGGLFSPLGFAKSTQLSLGIESYKETYREYEDDQRFMQQAGQLNAFNGSIKYHFNPNHSTRLEGRYAKGKIDYTGGENVSDEYPQGTPYGSVTQKNIPRTSYDIRSVYSYQQKMRPNLDIIGEIGLGYRVLKDLSSKSNPDDYDRKNKTAYAQIGVGAKIDFANNYDFTPKISYNHGIYGRQYSYLDDSTITLKQHKVRGLEIQLPISKTLSNHHKISYAPFYRGWRVPISDSLERIEQDENGNEGIAVYKEPKNYTHEIGFKLQYSF